MDSASWGPLVSGLIGGVLALWVAKKWTRWLPTKDGAKDAATLASENRWRTVGANLSFFGVILFGLVLFKGGYVARNDWRVLGLTFGFACVASVAFLYFSAAPLGHARVREAFTAYAISQRAPLAALVAIWGLGFVSLLIATFSLIAS